MKGQSTKPIRKQILNVNMVVILLTIILALGSTLYLTLGLEQRSMNEKLLNSARMLIQLPEVSEALKAGESNEQLWTLMDESTAAINDIDVIVVADTQGIQYYYPDHSYIGKPYAGKDQQRVFEGETLFISEDTGVSGAERCAYAGVRDDDGTLLGFVMVGIYVRSYTAVMLHTVFQFALVGVVVAAFGILLSVKLSDRIKRSLMGYEPSAIAQGFLQREEVLEALDEGILAIDKEKKIMYINAAAADMLDMERNWAMGRPLKEVYPASMLDRLLTTGKAEYNVDIRATHYQHVLSDRMPILSDGKVMGAVAIFRNRSEVTQLAEDLTGVRHMVDAMRAYTHEFMNKLHVILGLLQIGEAQKAEEYIMHITNIQREAVGLIMDRIEDASTAALLVGKTSRCTELGIRLVLEPRSYLSKQNEFLTSDSCVTILGNLIENAIDSLNQNVHGHKDITVSIRDEEGSLMMCVEDTGPGISAQARPLLFEKGFSTKGSGRGTGLSLVAEIVQAYHGEIRLESERGIGTSFFVTFQRQKIEADKPDGEAADV